MTINGYSNPNSDYSESIFVKYGSSISSSEFEVSSDYYRQVGIVAVAVTASGIVAIFLFLFGLTCRYCFKCCQCRPKPLISRPHVPGDEDDDGSVLEEYNGEDDEHYDPELASEAYHHNHPKNYAFFKTHPWTCGRITNFIFFLLFCAAGVTFNAFFLVGRAPFGDGVDQVHSSITGFNDVINNLKNDSSTLVDYGPDLQSEYDASKKTCVFVNAAPQIQDYINQYESSVSKLADYVKPLSGNIDVVDEYFQYYADGAVFYILWGVMLITYILALAFVFSEKRSGLQWTIGYGTVVMIVYILIGLILISLVMTLGDLCHGDPTYNLLSLLPSSSGSSSTDVQKIAQYYSTCQGNSTLQTDVLSGQKYLDDMQTALNQLQSAPGCNADPNLISMEHTVQAINGTLMSLYDEIGCQSIQPLWTTMLEDGLCTNLYAGIFQAWGAQILGCLCCFMMLMICSITYQYYPIYPHGIKNDGRSCVWSSVCCFANCCYLCGNWCDVGRDDQLPPVSRHNPAATPGAAPVIDRGILRDGDDDHDSDDDAGHIHVELTESHSHRENPHYVAVERL